MLPKIPEEQFGIIDSHEMEKWGLEAVKKEIDLVQKMDFQPSHYRIYLMKLICVRTKLLNVLKK